MVDITVDIEAMVIRECEARGIPADKVEAVHAIALKAAGIILGRLGGEGL